MQSRGYNVPDDPAKTREIFGYGWYKYAPEVAAELLLRNGFTRDKAGKWLLPDGKPWKINILSHPSPTPRLQELICCSTAMEEIRD